jgi:ELWxxDGT repeat protein
MLFFTAFHPASGCELWKSDGTEMGTVLVKDIHPSTFAFPCPSGLARVGELLLFAADNGSNGVELWKSDGTAEGTVMVRDIRPGPASSFPSELTDVNGTAFFRADDGLTGAELWRSDGTHDGTMLVKDIRPGAGFFGSSSPAALLNVAGTLFFTANDGLTGTELWKSDGSAADTVLVKDINPGPSGSFFGFTRLANIEGTVFLTPSHPSFGQELWKSDGTAAGTVLVKDVRLGSFGSAPSNLTRVGVTLFFTANDGPSGIELWRSDGTEAGTHQVKDIQPSPFASSFPSQLRDVGGILYFQANDGVTGAELWRSDGTAGGTVLVKDINPASSTGSAPASLIGLQDSVFFLFTADDGQTGRELWRSDGTAEGTVLVKDINIFTVGSSPAQIINVHGTAFFIADDGIHGRELWKSDGSAAGTMMVKDIVPGPGSPFPPFTFGFNNGLTEMNGLVFFVAVTPEFGSELWKTDGTAEGTSLVKDIRPAIPGAPFTGDSSPEWLTPLHGTLFFTADERFTGRELWKTDGTEAGTVLVKDIAPGVASSIPFHLTGSDDSLFFTPLFSTAEGAELWKSDGTEAGTLLVRDINPGPAGSNIAWLTDANGTLLFSAFDPVHGQELWRSDGTLAGTVLVRDINPGGASSFPAGLANHDGIVFFSADNAIHGFELWKSDGTEAGTVLVKDILPGPGSGFPFQTTHVSGSVLFRADDGITGPELWKSDGTEAGTVLVKDINPGLDGSLLAGEFSNPEFRAVNGSLFLTAFHPDHGVELWVSDGTEAGTVLVRDIAPDTFSSSSFAPRSLTNVSGTLFFSAFDPTIGFELWKVVEVVHIDVKPGSDTNPVNLNSSGVVPVAVLSDLGFDALTVDTSNLARIRFGDITVDARVSPIRSAPEDIDGDGDMDLLFFFSLRDLRESGALSATSRTVELTGFNQIGGSFRGLDDIHVVGPTPSASSLATGLPCVLIDRLLEEEWEQVTQDEDMA